MSDIADESWYDKDTDMELAFVGMEIEVQRLTMERDTALASMWGMICVATNRDNQTAEWRGLASIYLDRIFQERQEHWNELDRLRASVSLQARDGH